MTSIPLEVTSENEKKLGKGAEDETAQVAKKKKNSIGRRESTISRRRNDSRKKMHGFQT